MQIWTFHAILSNILYDTLPQPLPSSLHRNGGRKDNFSGQIWTFHVIPSRRLFLAIDPHPTLVNNTFHAIPYKQWSLHKAPCVERFHKLRAPRAFQSTAISVEKTKICLCVYVCVYSIPL